MKVKEIQDLLGFIATTGLNEVNLETADFKLFVKRNADAGTVHVVEQINTPRVLPTYTPTVENQPVPMATPATTVTADSGYITIKSPMVGTFYKAPSPDKPDFVQVGDIIKPGKTVCIIEAMKLFNEVEAEVSGKIVKILVENATPVEFDQPLFLVDPNA
jgi:acetyl-CoA carboxylase biotin carboxyl carrier protein